MADKIALCALLILFCLSRTISFGTTGNNTASRYAGTVPDLVNSVEETRLLSTLSYLTAFERSSYDAQESVLSWIKTDLDTTGAITRFHSYQYSEKTWRNLVATIPENLPADPGEKHLVVGAHIDTVAGSTGADDNAGGVAAVMEAVRVLANAHLGTRVDFVFFTNEERGKIGSAAYARDAHAAGEDITAMIAVDMVAYGPADEDLDLTTTPEYGWLANSFKESSDLYSVLPTRVVLDQSCG